MHTQYLISNSRAIRKRNDLIRKPKIVVPEFSSSHFGLIGIIRSIGLTKNDFEIEFCEAKQCLKKFRKGDVEVLALWPLLAEKELEQDGTSFINGSGVSVYSVACVVEKDTSQAMKIMPAAKEAIQKAKVWIDENKKQAKSLSQFYFCEKRSVVERAWGGFDFMAELDEGAKIDLSNMAEIMKKENWIASGDNKKITDIFL